MLEVPGPQYGAPWEKHQKCVANLSNVPAKVTARAGASVINQTCPVHSCVHVADSVLDIEHVEWTLDLPWDSNRCMVGGSYIHMTVV